jgi:dihydrofolate reductase
MLTQGITLIYARSLNDVIGKGSELPEWKIDGDLPRFKELTKGAVILMGRKTWDSLPKKLPGRYHAVITTDPRHVRKKGEEGPDAILDNPIRAIQHMRFNPVKTEDGSAYRKVFVIGGAQIYEELQHHVDFIEETVVMSCQANGDVHWKQSVPVDVIREERTTAQVREKTMNPDDRTNTVWLGWRDVPAIFRTLKVRK